MQIEAIEKEYKEIEASEEWNQLYQRIRSEGTYDLPCTEAKAAINRTLNRYRDVLPYDHTRIILSDTNTTYINASLVKEECVSRSYVLTQGPLSHTTPHFWQMIWQQKIKGIIMLNKIIEKNQIKCHQYWPLGEEGGGDDSIQFSTVGLKVQLVSITHHTHYNNSTLRLTHIASGESRTILHFHYTTWPDFGVPQSPEAFYKFLNVVRASGVLEPTVGPAVVHCSAGIGRSGTFCLVDTILMMLSKGLCENGKSQVIDVLLGMRKQRMGLIQTHDQLRFSYQAIVYGAHKLSKDGCKEDSSSEDGVNSEDDDDAPPPPPPPRTDSLTRSMIESQLLAHGDSEDSDDSEDEGLVGVPDRALPAEPTTPNDNNNSSTTNTNSTTNTSTTNSTNQRNNQTPTTNEDKKNIPMKDRDQDRDQGGDQGGDRGGDQDRDRGRDRGRDQDRGRIDRDRDRGRGERDRDRDRGGHRDQDRGRDRDRGGRNRDQSRRDRDRSRRDRDHDQNRDQSGRDRDQRDRDNDQGQDRGQRDRDRDQSRRDRGGRDRDQSERDHDQTRDQSGRDRGGRPHDQNRDQSGRDRDKDRDEDAIPAKRLRQ
ncbi:hypothetical protein Pcinc_025467 [Petrolisthes cinctipes]|uniref:protein-tyrosine-phosphatase n=1 Tax=Petrolisthes cinctipes TaxID=88211 RepID=A0AAE1F7T0_PETCI|nr:hypothetical protein Pcinc_025467 [Petrolisthes cinctipes]